MNEQLYKKAAEILKTNLSREEFLELQRMLDEDPDYGIYDAVTEIAAEMDPSNFVQPGEDPMEKIKR